MVLRRHPVVPCGRCLSVGDACSQDNRNNRHPEEQMEKENETISAWSGVRTVCYLTRVVPVRSTGTETTGWQDEQLLCHGVDLRRALLVPDDRNCG